jgi:hypothetical protein
VSKSSVSVAWLVMPIHWIRDEHTYMWYYGTICSSGVDVKSFMA